MVKTCVPCYLPMQKEKSLFHCNTHEETEVMAVCSSDVKTVILYRGFCLCL